jgi:hypothetical protein
MTRTRRAVPTWWSDAGAFVAPAVRIRAFRFNGKSQERYVPGPGSDQGLDERPPA